MWQTRDDAQRFGHANIQKQRFPCPDCGIEISYIMDLDQEAVTFDYRDPINASWIDDDGEEPLDSILFYPELMVPKDLEDFMSPFVVTCFHHKDIQEFQKVESQRRNFKDKQWPSLQRAFVHFEKRNASLFEKECAPLSKHQPKFDTWEERASKRSPKRHNVVVSLFHQIQILWQSR